MGRKPDVNWYSVAGESGGAAHQFYEDVPPAEWRGSDALKVTASRSVVVRVHGRVRGGAEDCVDVNNRSDGVHLQAAVWEPRGKFLATIKGGSRNVMLMGEVEGHGSVVDIDIGNVSDQSDELTGPVRLRLRHRSGDAITVRVLGGFRPEFLNADEQRYRVVFEIPGRTLKVIFLKGYKFLKKVLNPIGIRI